MRSPLKKTILNVEKFEGRVVMSTVAPASNFFADAVSTVWTQTQALGQLVVAPHGLQTLASNSIPNLKESFQNAAQNLPEALEQGSIATKDASNAIDHFWDKYAGGPTMLDQVPAFVGKTLTSPVTSTLATVSAITHVWSKEGTVLRDSANGKPVTTADAVKAAWDGIKDKKGDLAQAALDVVTGRVADKLSHAAVPKTPGQNPTRITTILTGKHAQDTLVRTAVDQVVSTVLDQTVKTGVQAAKHVISSPTAKPIPQPAKQTSTPAPKPSTPAPVQHSAPAPVQHSAPVHHSAPAPAHSSRGHHR